MTNSKTVAVFGATGAQGSPVVEAALAAGNKVRAVARNAAKIGEMHTGVEAFAADLNDKDAIAEALNGVDAAFLHLPMPTGPDDIQNWMGAFLAAAHEVALPLLVYTTAGPAGERFPSSMVVDGGTQGVNALLNCGIPTIVLQPAVYLEYLLPPIFAPELRSEGKLDYPPVKPSLKVQWTSHRDQGRIAAAALGRPDLAGQAFEIGSPDALTGPNLAQYVSRWLGRDVAFDPTTPEAFGQRVGDALGNPGIALALADLYGSISQLDGDAMSVDTAKIEEVFGIQLTNVADHLAGWART
ncbi:MAG: NmrA family NAD(P)-binding protein [Pseudomonadota bacterium]